MQQMFIDYVGCTGAVLGAGQTDKPPALGTLTF